VQDVNGAFEAAIIGGGAVGQSAALILGRCCRRSIVMDDGRPRNAVAERMHGFLTRDGTPPKELLKIAREQLRIYGCIEQITAHVEAIDA
jgi:thioredoxin reductase